MGNCLELQATVPRPDRPGGYDDDVGFSESFVESILATYTEPGDVVLDPFVGFGTTVAVAERMDRVGYGVELLEDRADFARARVAHPERVITGDARLLETLDLPPADFSLTSPPYMNRHEHPQNPLNGYRTLDGDYRRYLDELRAIYRQMTTVLKPGASAAINVANLKASWGVTFLAWDVGQAVAEVMEFVSEIPICWDRQHPAITQDYCLIFTNSPSA